MRSNILALASLALLAGSSRPLTAAPPPDTDLSSPIHAWFEAQHSVRGGWCCNLADGLILSDEDWRQAGDHYEVRIDNKWFVVDPSALRDPAGGPNTTGHAIVWYSKASYLIYCFAPGTEY